jgi:ATP adenylyltransferase
MVVPYAHLGTLEETPAGALQEMMRLTQSLEAVLRRLYRAAGINLGMNVGEAAGAGVTGHIHMHVLPRWVADSNFMTVISETRVLPEDLATTWQRLRAGLQTVPK